MEGWQKKVRLYDLNTTLVPITVTEWSALKVGDTLRKRNILCTFRYTESIPLFM